MALSQLLPFLSALLPFLLVGGWCGRSVSLARKSGWSRLAEHFLAGDRQPSGTRFTRQGAIRGQVGYRSTLTIHSSAEGLHLAVWLPFRPGHPPLFIPWDAVCNVTNKRCPWAEVVTFEAGSPNVATLHLSEKVFEGHRRVV